MGKELSAELLPCPFCGGKPGLSKAGRVVCSEGDACIAGDLFADAEDWNRRAAPPPPQWISVEERLPEPGEHVLAYYTNSLSKGRRIRAEYVAAMSREVDWECADTDTQCVEHDEQSDCFYLTAGWYELLDNWDEYSSIAVVEGVISHWMPLPPPPSS